MEQGGIMSIKREDTVYFKLKPFDKYPVIKGIVKNRSANLFWIQMQEIRGKKASGMVCVGKKNILKKENKND